MTYNFGSETTSTIGIFSCGIRLPLYRYTVLPETWCRLEDELHGLSKKGVDLGTPPKLIPESPLRMLFKATWEPIGCKGATPKQMELPIHEFPFVPKLLGWSRKKHPGYQSITGNSPLLTPWFQTDKRSFSETWRLLLPHRRGWWQILSTSDQGRLRNPELIPRITWDLVICGLVEADQRMFLLRHYGLDVHPPGNTNNKKVLQ